MHLLVMAKAPVAGRVKTRLCPPCTPEEAAAIAEAALADTLEAVRACGADRHIVALDGQPGPWLPSGFEVIAQSAGGLEERLGAAWAEAGGPGFQIGMDTPQITADDLDRALGALVGAGDQDGVGKSAAVLGRATDGGWWGIGMLVPEPEAFVGVPMSTEQTGDAQRSRLEALGCTVVMLDEHRDIDTIDDLLAVAATMTGGRTPAVAAALEGRLTVGPSR